MEKYNYDSDVSIIVERILDFGQGGELDEIRISTMGKEKLEVILLELEATFGFTIPKNIINKSIYTVGALKSYVTRKSIAGEVRGQLFKN